MSASDGDSFSRVIYAKRAVMRIIDGSWAAGVVAEGDMEARSWALLAFVCKYRMAENAIPNLLVT